MSVIDKYRDPVHGFINVTSGENKIINSAPFQRLRNIRQLAMTYLIFHGAEHTRFGHSIGVMHLVAKSFDSVTENSEPIFSKEKAKWYRQILRLIALTHDLGHAPFSHASESVFADGLEHESYTARIIKETCIADYIREIGDEYKNELGEEYDITPELICNIYMGKEPGKNSEFTFLKSFMDSELDCDKMDYLLRDSLFCGVKYGEFDIDRLISSLIIHIQDDCPKLAISSGGVQVFEEFVLARYFMFVQVYFHRTRRYFDIMFFRALTNILPDGKYPIDIEEYLKWDDCRVIQLMKEYSCKDEACRNIVERITYPCVQETKTHPEQGDKTEFRLIALEVQKAFGEEKFLEDNSADKMPHKIPTKSEITDEKAIVIVHKNSGKLTTISEESHIIKNLTDKINIWRLYVNTEISDKVKKHIQDKYRQIQS